MDDGQRLRAELSSYLDDLKASASVTLPDDFDAIVGSLTANCASLPSSPDAPHWLSHSPSTRTTATKDSSFDPADAAIDPSELLPTSPPQPGGSVSAAAQARERDGVQELGEAGSMAVSAESMAAQLDGVAIGLRYSEEAEMRKIAELDALLDRLTAASSPRTATAHRTPQQHTPATATAETSSPLTHHTPPTAADDDDDDEQTTFITAIHTREPVAQLPHPREEEEKEALTLHAQPLREELEDEDTGERVSRYRVSAGEGFTLSSHEEGRMRHIEGLISALQADEKAGKRRRFVRRQRSGSRLPRREERAGVVDTEKPSNKKEGKEKDGERSRKGRREDRGRDVDSSRSRLPAILPTPQQPPIAAAAASGVTASAPSSSSSSPSSYLDSLASLLDGCLSNGERQRLDDIDARLSRTSDSPADAMAAYDDVGAGSTEGGEAGDQYERFDADAYLKAIHHHQPSLTVSSLSDWYGHPHRNTQRSEDEHGTETANAADGDPYEWMDAGLDLEDEATRAMDDAEAADSVLPDSDDDERDAVWSHLQSLAIAPDPSEEKEGEGGRLLFAQQPSLEERAQATQAGAEAARQRVQRLVREAEERKRRLSGTAASDAQSAQGAERRVRTSDEAQRVKASPHLVPLSKRPASAEATPAIGSSGRRPTS